MLNLQLSIKNSNLYHVMKFRNILVIWSLLFSVVTVVAQTEKSDTIKTQQLKEVVVETQQTLVTPSKSIYVPSAKQKRSAMSGEDLIKRMRIPEIVNYQGQLMSTSLTPVSFFIDYHEASSSELNGMNMNDVKRVEYFAFPDDPRFMGKEYVINFIMVKYEYGGYTKFTGVEHFIENSGNGSIYNRFQYGKMTYDLTGGGSYSANSHNGSSETELFRLPQLDNTIETFERVTDINSSKYRSHNSWVTFRATYSSKKVDIRNTVGGNFKSTPVNNSNGNVSYFPELFSPSKYTNDNDSHNNSFSYRGDFNIYLPKKNTIVITPIYKYSHTRQNSLYTEDYLSYINGAVDNSHQASATASFTHNFGKPGQLSASIYGSYSTNRTWYSGTSTGFDVNRVYRFGPEISYSGRYKGFYGRLSLGYNWDKSNFNDVVEVVNSPAVSTSLQYAFNTKNKVSASYNLSRWAPSSNYKSANMIKVNPLMTYTGNPDLIPMNQNRVTASYTFVPNKIVSLSAGTGWSFFGDRYVYDYIGTPTGVIRTIKQPMGNYSLGNYTLSANADLLDGNLSIGGNIKHVFAHNGAPYNWSRSWFNWGLQVFYYFGDFYLGAFYDSKAEFSDGIMVGDWMKRPSDYSLQIGWSNSHWNVRLFTSNFFRYSWKNYEMEMNSQYYDRVKINYGTDRHFMVQLRATYTFSYGKKIRSNNQVGEQSGTASGILKNEAR